MNELIAERISAKPGALAVHAWDGDLTYGELDALSHKLACHLVSMGVVSGSLVPLCFEKSLFAVVTVLAVLKAGGGFVFLSPGQPQDRLRTILEEVGGSIIITSEIQQHLAKEIAPDMRNFAVSKSSLSALKPPKSAISLPSPAPESTLYVIFTSGSTGKPKGVSISHANYTSGALPRAEAVGYKSTSRVLDFAAYVFDVSIDCTLCTLAQGGCLCIPSEEDRMNSLSSVITKLGVNMAHMTPSVARVLDPEVMSSLDVLGLGGEGVPADDAAVWNERTKVIVAYGPSECTVGCTINNEVGGDTTPYVSIGKGVGGLMWIVDPNDHNILVPPGAIGELVVEGPIVGQGYLNRPDLTEKVFINDPPWLIKGHKHIPGRQGRLYKTGDLVSYSLLDGPNKITFVARKDQQVKIRGQRVELGEIEHHLRLNLHNQANVTAEVIRPGGLNSEPMLVAFIAEAEENTETTTSSNLVTTFSAGMQDAICQANEFLSQRLPSYMVPSAYIPVIKIPTLVSCKIDRKQLREIGSGISRSQLAKLTAVSRTEGNMALTTDKEKLLGRLWAEVIDLDIKVQRTDNFFHLGGDSLKAMKLVSSGRKEGLDLSVAEVFAHPSLSEMAEAATSRQGSTAFEEPEPQSFSLLPSNWDLSSVKTSVAKLCHIEIDDIEDIYPCTPLQEGLMALSAKIPDAYVAQRVVTIKSPKTASKLKLAFQKVFADSPIFRTRIIQVPFKGLLQVVTRSKVIPWRTGMSLKAYLEEDKSEHMELGTPLVRFGVIDHLHSGGADFVLTIHHALYDGWSMQQVVQHINNAYQGYEPPKATPFSSFIRYLGSLDKKVSKEYWRNYLDRANGPQFPQHPYQGYQTKADSLLERYITLPRSQKGTTAATIIRAAWALVAARELGISDVVFGETLTGRNIPIVGVEGIEGPMITTLPMRVRLREGMTVAELIQDVHQQTVIRIPHEHFGLQNVRRLSEDAREACDLKTGLVLHPASEPDQEKGSLDLDTEPANGFVPVDDAEAAREALKFNTYALMLVCSLESQGFLVMASFDSKTVKVPQMERVLKHLDIAVQRLYEMEDSNISEIDLMDVEDIADLWQVSEEVTLSEKARQKMDLASDINVKAIWIVSPNNSEHLLPVGAVGQVLVECTSDNTNGREPLIMPSWFENGIRGKPSRQGLVYETNQIGRLNAERELTIMGSIDSWGQQSMTPSSVPSQNRSLSVENKIQFTRVQKQLLPIWSRALCLEKEEVDPSASFFALGGDSIGAMKLVSEARHLGFELSVADIFKHKTLVALSKIAKFSLDTQQQKKEQKTSDKKAPSHPATSDSGYDSPQSTNSPSVTSSPGLPIEKPFSILVSSLLHDLVRPQLQCGIKPEIVDLLPTRPLQDIAIHGTIQNPKFSLRYEIIHLTGKVNHERLFKACRDLVQANEILRTVFVSGYSGYLAVVLKSLDVPINAYEIAQENDPIAFAHAWCQLDVQTVQKLGNTFLKFMLVSTSDKASLVFRISHAQYDEMCLPLMLAQLEAFYSGSEVPETLPYSAFVAHAIPRLDSSMKYWHELLLGSNWTSLPWPNHPPVALRGHYAVEKTFEITSRPEFTLATLPTAAWAIFLSKATGARDVLFGEVVSGRSSGLRDAGSVVGPTWQYVPVRVQLREGMKASEVLDQVQTQHAQSAAHECVSVREMVNKGAVPRWTPPWLGSEVSASNTEPWMPTVVHQAVKGKGQGVFDNVKAKFEPLYLHEEPLREWKTQAFVEDGGKRMTLEIVTFEGWREYANEVLEKLGAVFTSLVEKPDENLVL